MVSNTKPAPHIAPSVPKTITSEWCQWFAWYPVKVNSKWVWRKTVYRRPEPAARFWHESPRWEYGTAFDVIRGDNTTCIGQVPPKPAPPPRYVK